MKVSIDAKKWKLLLNSVFLITTQISGLLIDKTGNSVCHQEFDIQSCVELCTSSWFQSMLL